MSQHKTEKCFNNINYQKKGKFINGDRGNFSNYWICPAKNVGETCPKRTRG